MSDSVRPYRRQPTRLPRPWDSPGKNTGVGCHFLLQTNTLHVTKLEETFPKQLTLQTRGFRQSQSFLLLCSYLSPWPGLIWSVNVPTCLPGEVSETNRFLWVLADGSLLISTPSHLALTSALWPDREPEQRAGPISIPPHSTSSPSLGPAAQDRLINTMHNEWCAQGHTTSSNESETNSCNFCPRVVPAEPCSPREPPNNFSVDWRPRDKCHFWPR